MPASAEQFDFGNGPRTELDRALADLMGSAQKVLQTQGRLRNLLTANQALVGKTDLPSLLRSTVEAAVELIGARYGALGVIAPEGGLEQFIHVGMPEDTVRRIGHLPEGKGLLGALIDDPQPIRLERLGTDRRSAGFPHDHPPMESFLGVPIRIRDEVYGNLYLAEHRAGPFSDEDTELLTALAATAGIAIDNARLFEASERRQQWSAASAEMSGALLSERSDRPLQLLAERVCSLTEASLVMVVIPVGDNMLSVEIARGSLAEDIEGVVFNGAGSLAARALESGQPILAMSEAATGNGGLPVGVGPTMVVPLSASGGVQGVLTVSRTVGAHRYSASDVDMAADFAAQASVALELDRGRTDRQRLALLEDRSRIARDLHDHVIQRLFAAGLGLQAIDGVIGDAGLRRKLSESIDTLDAAITEIRTAIFALGSEPRADQPSIRHRIVDLLGELDAAFAVAPRLVFSGPVDLHTPEPMMDDLLAVVREGLSNVAKHAAATEAIVRVTASEESITVEIEDDGVGVPRTTTSRRSGIANLAVRAAGWDGTFSLSPGESGGTLLRWTGSIDGGEPR